jgi:uncharacterized protein (TIGR02217 family)
MVWGTESLIEILPERFIPWITSKEAGTPLFINKVNFDGAGNSETYQIFKQVDVSIEGLALFAGDTGEIFLEGCDLEYFLAFFNARKGRIGTFQFRYWADCTCTELPNRNCFDNNIFTQGVTYPFTGNGEITNFKLLKLYTDNVPFDNSYRRIFRPIASSIKMFVNGIENNNFTILPNGIIEFNTPPPNEALIRHRCEFDILVRFDVDSYAIETISTDPERYRLSSIPVIEVIPNL